MPGGRLADLGKRRGGGAYGGLVVLSDVPDVRCSPVLAVNFDLHALAFVREQ
jgi:hypothetical protein